MICPDCANTVSDDARVCPECGAPLEGASPAPLDADAASEASGKASGARARGRGAERSARERNAYADAEFLFCEGCGARLMSSDRVCPKCGRPAPGILSTQSASSDLAAGKTASFPKITPELLAETPAVPAQVAPSAADPSATSVLDAGDLAAASVRPRAPRAGVEVPPAVEEGADGKDPYRRPRRGRRVLAVLAVLLVAGGIGFAVYDPLGVMPGVYASVGDAAAEMFPSREHGTPADADKQAGGETDEEGEQVVDDATLSEAEAYRELHDAYKQILAQHDALGTIIEDYEAGFLANDIDTRTERSRSAYGARDALDAVIEELQAMKLQEGSAYADDVENLLQLAGWVRERIDMYCASWDLSLSYTDPERPSDHQQEILAPLRDRKAQDAEARDNFFAHMTQWEPKEGDAA